MNMPVIAIVMGLLLGLVGAAGAGHAISQDKEFVTALIPAYLGAIFIALGAFSLLKPSLRKHLMHALAALALLGLLAAGGRLASTWSKANVSPIARGSQAAMAGLCAVTVGLCVMSFRAARNAREAALPPL